jgi:hypothetical protein
MKEKGVFFASLTALFILWIIGIMLPSIPGINAAINQTVLTKLNVTNTEPHVYNVTITPNSLTLTAGTTTNLTCNGTVTDYNGVPTTISNVTAIFYLNSTSPTDPTKNDTKYVVNCTNVTTFSSSSALYTCDLNIWFFARNGTWSCNITAIDQGHIGGSDRNESTIQPLVALNVSDVIDYGNVPVGNISDERDANITNFGNIPINISVRGWGGQNESLYPNLSMICDLGNISVDLERYNITTGQAWSNMINLTDTNALIRGLVVNMRNDSFNPINKTYWRISVPFGIGGQCNGTVLFTASSA